MEFKTGEWVALVLPDMRKAIGIVSAGQMVDYAAENHTLGTMPLEDVEAIAKLTIDWEGAE